jgi:hypothetical protein
MGFLVNRLQIRLIRANRDFNFVDKIGALTNAFINFLPNTELQRNGEYGALIIINNVYNFQSQITQNEINLTVNIDRELGDKDFNEVFESVLDLSERIISTIKKNLGALTDMKSMICLIDGKLEDYQDEEYNNKLKSALHNSFLDIESDEVKQINYIWKEGLKESFVHVIRENNTKKIVYAIQDFSKPETSFSKIRLLISDCFSDLNKKVISKL